MVFRAKPRKHIKKFKINEKCGCGVRGVWGAIFTLNTCRTIARRRFILLHSGLVTFRLIFTNIRTSFSFTVLGLCVRISDFHDQYNLSLERPLNGSSKFASCVVTMFGALNISEMKTIENVGEGGNTRGSQFCHHGRQH